jgi:succinate dehydrogenase / fumarate reductase flavoprotein subunit
LGRARGTLQTIAHAPRAAPLAPRALSEALDDLNGFLHEGEEIVRPVQRSLRNTMWERCGVVRSKDDLRRGLQEVAELKEALEIIDVRPTSEGFGDLAHVLDLRASIATAEATLLGALERRESRGCHNRADYPDQDQSLTVNLRSRLENEGLVVEHEQVPPVSPDLREWVEGAEELDTSKRLLE